MTSKYAAARDVAFQWRAEHRKVKRENESLRRVYAAAMSLIAEIEDMPMPVPAAECRLDLKQACRNAVFAVTPPTPTQGKQQ